jgi:transcription elongation GreA/GreB family factor
VTERGLALIAARVAELEAELAALSDEEAIKKHRRVMRYWLTRQATAQLMPPPTGPAVAFGSTVTIRLNGKERTITLVGDDEADPAAGLLSFTAPLSRALMGAEAGDEVDFGGKSGAIAVLRMAAA